MAENGEQKKKKKKKISYRAKAPSVPKNHIVVPDEIPVKGPKIFTKDLKGDTVEFLMKSRSKVKLEFGPLSSKCQDSRRWFNDGFASKLKTYKTRTNDDGIIILKKCDLPEQVRMLSTRDDDLDKALRRKVMFLKL